MKTTAGIEPEVEVWFLEGDLEGPTSYPTLGQALPPALAPASTPGLSTSLRLPDPTGGLSAAVPTTHGWGTGPVWTCRELTRSQQSWEQACHRRLQAGHRRLWPEGWGLPGPLPTCLHPSFDGQKPRAGKAAPSIWKPPALVLTRGPRREWALRVCFAASLMLLGAFDVGGWL